MQLKLAKGSLTISTADVVVVTCFEREGSRDGGVDLNRALKGELNRVLTAQQFSGKEGKTVLIPTFGLIPAKFVLVVGLGKRKDCSLAVLRTIGAVIAKKCDAAKAASLAVTLERQSIGGLSPAMRLQVIVEGMLLGMYRFEQYREADARTPPSLKNVSFLVSGPAQSLEHALTIGQAIGNAVCFSRDLGNTPGNDMTPTILAREAKRVASEQKLGIEVWGPAEMKKERMGAFLSVAQGSVEPPALVHLTYRPRGKARAKVALVGKGVTFDSGGISIKPSKNMHEMKYDMCGAAVVLGAIEVIAKAKIPVAVDAYLAASENLPDAKAYKPGDIVTARNGKTIEIISTDAEGRLLLADTLTLAAEKKPDYLIDLATLTGGASYAVGELYAALLGNNQKLVDRLLKASTTAAEKVWQLPLEKNYLKGLTRGPADLVNSGGSTASTMTAALFLSQFVGDTHWAHFDIAACAWTTEDNTVNHKGATGAVLATLVAFVSSL